MKTNTSRLIVVALLSLALTHCKDGSESQRAGMVRGGSAETSDKNNSGPTSGKTENESENGNDQSEANETAPTGGNLMGGKVSTGAPTETDKKALAGCANAWGPNPPVDLTTVRRIAANVSVLSSATLRDDRVSAGPELTIVYGSVSVLGAPKWELLNPNGWYCIVTNVNVLSKLTVTLSKTAHLADNRIQVDVLSKNQGNVGSIGVNVLSDVKVILK